MLHKMVQTFWGGYDTTGSTLASVLRYVAQHPNVYDELIREHASVAATKAEGELLTMEDVRNMKYTWRVVNESMRLTPGVWREANKDFKYKEFTIHKGDTVVLSAACSYWREEFYKDWEKFDPSRFEKGPNGGAPPFSFFPFGGGHRLCPGKEFARMNMTSFLYHFLRYIKWDLVNPEEKTVYQSFPAPAQGLPLRITKVTAF